MKKWIVLLTIFAMMTPVYAQDVTKTMKKTELSSLKNLTDCLYDFSIYYASQKMKIKTVKSFNFNKKKDRMFVLLRNPSAIDYDQGALDNHAMVKNFTKDVFGSREKITEKQLVVEGDWGEVSPQLKITKVEQLASDRYRVSENMLFTKVFGTATFEVTKNKASKYHYIIKKLTLKRNGLKHVS